MTKKIIAMKNYLRMRNEGLKDFLREEDGVGVVEVILILVVIIGLVLIFKEQLNTLVESLFETINDKAGSVWWQGSWAEGEYHGILCHDPHVSPLPLLHDGGKCADSGTESKCGSNH